MWLNKDKSIINLGLSSFAKAIAQKQGKPIMLDWQPLANGDAKLGLKLGKLLNHPKINLGNKIAFGHYLSASPALIAVNMARNVIPLLREHKCLTYSGPPCDWNKMDPLVQQALIGASLFERWAKDETQAKQMLASGEIQTLSCHFVNAVGAAAGVISPSMYVWVVRNNDNNQLTFSNLADGLAPSLQAGNVNEEVLAQLEWMKLVLGPSLNKGVEQLGELELIPLMVEALTMGDELNYRTDAASGLFFRQLVPALLKTQIARPSLEQVLSFLAKDNQCFLPLAMAACKSMLDSARNVPNSTMVTAMTQNAQHFAIQLSSTGDKWFEAPLPKDEVKPLGDNAIIETAGFGAFALVCAPSITKALGSSFLDAIAMSKNMQKITMDNHPHFTLSVLNFKALNSGIDLLKVIDSQVLPRVNSLNLDQGEVKKIKASLTKAPLEVFLAALEAFELT